jgi:hypothetical protein
VRAIRPSQYPEAHRPSAPGQYPIAVTARRLDSRHESVPRGTRAVSAPRAVGCVLEALSRLHTEPSRAASVPASGPRDPSRAGLSVSGAATRPPATLAFAPTLSQASFTAPQRPPGYLARPRPAPPTLGAPNTSVPRSLVTQAHRPSVPPGARAVSKPPSPGLATSVQASGPGGPKQSGTQQTHAHRMTVPFRRATRPNGPSQVSQWVRPRFEPGALTTDPLCNVQWRAGVQNTERAHACTRALGGRRTGSRAKERERER